ncbi:MAG: PAS domain-containing protein [Candidatus Latescibacterota bacterium]
MERRWRELMDLLPQPALLVDGSLNVLGCTRRAPAIFGLRLRGPEGEPEDRLTRALAGETALGDPLALAGARLRRPAEAESFTWQSGERTYGVTVSLVEEGVLLVLFADVSEQVRAERILQDARRYLEQILDGVPLGVTVLSRALRLTAINRQELACLGRMGRRLGLAEAIGAAVDQVFPAAEAPSLLAVCQRVLETGQAVQDGRRECAAEGARMVLATVASPLRDAHGHVEGVILIRADVTLQVHLEEELLRVEKLATIGKLAITVNHEINNPLGIISSTAQSLRLLNPNLDEKTAAKLQRIEAQVHRIAEVTQRLRALDEVRTSEYIESGPEMIDLWNRQPGRPGNPPAEE